MVENTLPIEPDSEDDEKFCVGKEKKRWKQVFIEFLKRRQPY